MVGCLIDCHQSREALVQHVNQIALDGVFVNLCGERLDLHDLFLYFVGEGGGDDVVLFDDVEVYVVAKGGEGEAVVGFGLW